MPRRLVVVCVLLLSMLVGMSVAIGEWPTAVTGWTRGGSESSAVSRPQETMTDPGSTLSVEQLTRSEDLGLLPGEPKVVRLRVTNGRSPAPVSLLGVDVTWGDAGPGCGRENLLVTPWTAGRAARVSLAPAASTVIDLRIELLETRRNQDACRRAVFPLRFTVTGRT